MMGITNRNNGNNNHDNSTHNNRVAIKQERRVNNANWIAVKIAITPK